MSRRMLQGGVAVLLVVVIGVVIERLIVTDEEAVRALAAEFVSATEEEDLARVTAVLAPGFGWSGVPPVGRGRLEDLPERLDYFWTHMESTRYRYDVIELTLQGETAVLDLYGPLRFEWDGWLGLYRAQFQLTMAKQDDEWLLRRVEVTDLQRGAL